MEALLILVVSAVIVYFGYNKLKKNISDQADLIAKLASKNGWEFVSEPDPNQFSDIAAQIGLDPKALKVLFLVRGSAYGKDFELFSLVGTTGSGITAMNARLNSPRYATLLRTSALIRMPNNVQNNLYSELTFNGANYLIYGANAMQEAEISAIISALS